MVVFHYFKQYHSLCSLRSMRHNLIALLADLYNLFEVHPSKCVNYPGMEQQSGKSE